MSCPINEKWWFSIANCGCLPEGSWWQIRICRCPEIGKYLQIIHICDFPCFSPSINGGTPHDPIYGNHHLAGKVQFNTIVLECFGNIPARPPKKCGKPAASKTLGDDSLFMDLFGNMYAIHLEMHGVQNPKCCPFYTSWLQLVNSHEPWMMLIIKFMDSDHHHGYHDRSS